MRTVEAQGYSKEKALEATGLDVKMDMMKNATTAWKKAGSPMNTKDLNKFMSEYIKKNKVVGAYLVIESAIDDSRVRPYNVINETTTGKRKTTTVYQIKEAELAVKLHPETKEILDEETGEKKLVEVMTPYRKETITVEVTDKETGEKSLKEKEVLVPEIKVIGVGSVEARADKKDTAFKLMKELIEANHKDYVVEIVKEVATGQKYAGYGQYTPSKSAKVGKFLFFVQE